MTDAYGSLLLRIEDVVAEVKLGESTIREMVKRGLFPKPILLGPRAKRWRREDIMFWIESLATESSRNSL